MLNQEVWGVYAMGLSDGKEYTFLPSPPDALFALLTSLSTGSLLFPGVLPAVSLLICSRGLQSGYVHHYLGSVYGPWLGFHPNNGCIK